MDKPLDPYSLSTHTVSATPEDAKPVPLLADGMPEDPYKPYVPPDTPETDEPPDDPCEKLQWAANVQQVAQAIVQQAASGGKQIIDRLFGYVNEFMGLQLGAIKAIEKKCKGAASRLLAQANKYKASLLAKLNAEAIQLSKGMHSVTQEVTHKLNTELNPEGAEPIVAPGFQPIPHGTTLLVPALQGPQVAATVDHFGNPITQQGTPHAPAPNQPPQASPGSPGKFPPSLSAAQSYSPAAQTRPPPGAPLFPGVPAQSALSVSKAEASAVATAQVINSIAVNVSPGAMETPIVNVTLGDLAITLCNCLQSAAPETPVDLDTPLAFRFGEAGDVWHQQAIAFSGSWLADVMDAPTFADLWALREPAPNGPPAQSIPPGQFPYE